MDLRHTASAPKWRNLRLFGPPSPIAQASRLARLAVIGLEVIARAALVPDDVGLVSEDHVAGEGIVHGSPVEEAEDQACRSQHHAQQT